MVDQIRFFAGAARVLEGKSAGEYMARPHLVRPPRADRRRRPGDAVELPADDGDLEDRARRSRPATRSCSSRRDTTPASTTRCSPRSGPGVPARRASSTSSSATATPAGRWSSTPRPSWSSITGSVRAGMEVAGVRGHRASSASTSSSAARRRSIVFDDADLEAAAEGDRRRRATSTPGRTAPRRRGCWSGPAIHDEFVAALAERHATPGPGCPTTTTSLLRPAQQRRPARRGSPA